MMKQAGTTNGVEKSTPLNEQKKTGAIRIGVYEPKTKEQLDVVVLQQQLVTALSGDDVEAIAITSEQDAKKYNCDFLLATEFLKFKQGSKVGGILKAIKNTDPFATSSFNIEASLTLTKLSDGSTRVQEKVNGRYEGKPETAAAKALEEGCQQLVGQLK